MTDGEIKELCHQVVTWDQAELDNLLGQPAIEYAEQHQRNVLKLAGAMWSVFPLGANWWRIRRALLNVRHKNNAIKARAAQIGADRQSGKIIELNGRLHFGRG